MSSLLRVRPGRRSPRSLWSEFGTWLGWFDTGMRESPSAYGAPGSGDEDRPAWDEPALGDEARLARYNERSTTIRPTLGTC
jgi:hypothetical protein